VGGIGGKMTVVDRLLRWLEIPINLLLWIGLAAGFLMMLHVSADVTGRTVFNRPLHGTTEIVSGWYMVAICYLPWAWIERRDNHIVAGMFENFGTARFSFWLGVFVKIVTFTYCVVFCWQTWTRAVQQTWAGPAGEVWEAAGGFIPVWPSRWMLPMAAGLMALYLVLRVVRDIGLGYQPVHHEGEPREGGI
jgi:TRAP-type C4-dicarboxylate transport system permease small subunit